MVQPSDQRRVKRPLVLVLLVLASLGLVVVKLRSPNRVQTVGRWTVGIFSPLFEGGRWASDCLREGALQVVQAQTSRMENRRLKADNAQLALEIAISHDRIGKLERERSSELPTLPDTVLSPLYANVIGISNQRWDHTLTIDRGKLDGVRTALPVVDFSGAIVGIVSATARHQSTIQLITDPGFKMGAMIEDNANRERGLLIGLGEKGLVRFRPNEPQKPLQGTQVISTGFEGSLYPKGLVIGRIVKFNKDKYGTDYWDVVPKANFDSLEEVIVVDSQTVYHQPATRPSASAPVTAPAVQGEEGGAAVE